MEITPKDQIYTFLVNETVGSLTVSALITADLSAKTITQVSGGVIANSEGVELTRFNCGSSLTYTITSNSTDNVANAEIIEAVENAVKAHLETF